MIGPPSASECNTRDRAGPAVAGTCQGKVEMFFPSKVEMFCFHTSCSFGLILSHRSAPAALAAMPMRNGAVQDPVNCRNHPNASADAAPPKLPMVNISPEM